LDSVPAVRRLPTSEDFKRVRAAKRSLAHPLLILYTAPNDAGRPRVGVTVSRRSAREFGKAVVRNRVRRRVSEAARRRLADSAAGLDLVFIARGPSATADWPALAGAVDELLRRARATRESGTVGGRGGETPGGGN
jgi:ribonuclease P protein component